MKISESISLNQASKIAGFGLLFMFIFGIFADSIAFQNIIHWDNPSATVENIRQNGMLLRFGIVSYIGDLITNIIVALGLYFLVKPVNKSLALLTVMFRLIYVALRGSALFNLFYAIQLTHSGNIEINQLKSQVMLFLHADKSGYIISLIFFGFHILILGYLIYKSGYIPKLLGVLLLLAFFGYSIYCFSYILLPNFSSFETVFTLILAVPGFLAELTLCLWLIFKGIKSERLKEISNLIKQ